MRGAPLLIACLGLSLFGFGCKQPDYKGNQAANWRGIIQGIPNTTTKTAAPTAAPKASQKLFDTVQPQPSELPTLRQALTNLASAKSFKATLTLPPADGQTTPIAGSLIFDRDRGFRGSIILSPQVKSEILSTNNQIYFRANTSSWQMITGTADGDRLQAFFNVAFPNKTASNQLLVSDSIKITSVSQDQSGCRLYLYSEVLPTGDRAQTSLCIKDTFPVYIINEYAEGSTKVIYSEINQPVSANTFAL